MRKQAGVLPIVLVVLAACSSPGNTDGASGGGDADGGASLACRHFRNTADDFADGQLTMSELRSKLQEVEDDASVSEEPGVATSARAMVAAITSGDDAGLNAAIRDMDRACTSAGV